jgi:hypothetical protein
MSLADLETHFEVSRTVFMLRHGLGRQGGICSNKKLCFVAHDKEHLVGLLLDLTRRPDCYVVKYSIEPRDTMYLGRAFMTGDEVVGKLWAEFHDDPKVFCSIQDDDFAERFRRSS